MSKKARLDLLGFLWTEKNSAFELPLDIKPGSLQQQPNLTLDSALLASEIHPALLEYQYKMQVLEIEKRMKFQALLPQVNAKYNFIGRNFNRAIKNNFFENNYRLAFKAFRCEYQREGEYKAARLKLNKPAVNTVEEI